MNLRSGEQYTLDTDPLHVLMLAECETVEDEYEVASLFDQCETVMLAMQNKSSINTKD